MHFRIPRHHALQPHRTWPWLPVSAGSIALALTLFPIGPTFAASPVNPKIARVTAEVLNHSIVAHAVSPSAVTVDYQFQMQAADGSWSIVRRFAPGSRFAWTLPRGASGIFKVKASALTAFQVRHHDWSLSVHSAAETIAIASPIHTVTLALSSNTLRAVVGHSAGVSVEIQFRVERPTGAWSVLRRFQPGNQITWKPPTGSGTYLVEAAALTPYQVTHQLWTSAVRSAPLTVSVVRPPTVTPPVTPPGSSSSGTLPAPSISSSGILSIAYGEFIPNADSSYSSMLADPDGLSVIAPTWYYDDEQSPMTFTYGGPELSMAPMGAATTVAVAHQDGIQVWPMIGAVSVQPFESAAAIASTVRQITDVVETNDYDGITIDFEPTEDNGLTLTQVSTQYTAFITALGAALHADNKKLMVDVYPYSYPESPYDFAAIAPSVNYIDIMSYGEFDSATEEGPTQGLGWDQNIYQAAITAGVNPSQLILGFGPYGDYWSINNSGLDQNAPLGDDSYVSDAQVQQLLEANPAIDPIWDPEYGSEVFTSNEYLNGSDNWTVNPSGSAVAPTDVLSTADESSVLGQVQNLQGLLNYVLMRYAEENQQPLPSLLNLAQDGQYGPLTEAAVAQFQQNFNVTGDPSGVYGPNTQAALKKVIAAWNIGTYQYWVDNSQSLENRLSQVVIPDHLAGIAIWREPFEDSNFWSYLATTVDISPHGE